MVFEWDRDVSPEEAEIIIDKIAKKVVEYGLEMPAIYSLNMIYPVAQPGAEVLKIMGFPFLGLIGESSYKVINTLKKRENLQKLIDRIEELSSKKH